MEEGRMEFNAVFLGRESNGGHAGKLRDRVAANPRIHLFTFLSFEDLKSHPVYGAVQILIVFFTPTEQFLQIVRENPIQWVHSYTVGVDKYLVPEFVDSPIPLTNARGLYSQSLAEYAFCVLLRFNKKFPLLESQQAAKQWRYFASGNFSQMTMLILGFGDIGKAVARMAKHGFGMKVIGIRKHPEKDELADEVHGMEKLHELLPRADILIMCLPATPSLTHIISTRELSLLKPHSLLINLGRGLHLDEPALISSLQSGHLSGAGLDVFSTEPLPPDSPLWTTENLLVSPHNADHLLENQEKTAVVFDHTLALFLAGTIQSSPNIVRKEQGY